MSSPNTADSSAADTSAATDLTIINILTYAFLFVVMFGIGAAVKLSDLRMVLRHRKVAMVVGLASQYLVMPAAARLVAKVVLRMPDADAFGVILLGCCPGGSTSNAYAYFARADLALSIAMTAISNALAFGTLPLLLFLWTRGMDSVFGTSSIPFLDIFSSLCMVLLPAALGVAVQHYHELWARRAERLGAASGAVMIVSAVFAGLVQNRATLADTDLFPWKNGVAVALVAPIGCAFAVVAMWCVNALSMRKLCGLAEPLPVKVIATVVMETGIQNVVIALAICRLISDDWDPAPAFRLELISILWGIFVSAEAIVLMLVFRWAIRQDESAERQREPHVVPNQEPST